MSGVNGARGEVALAIDGETHVLCLTLGALAELENTFGAEDLGALARRMAQLNASDIIDVLCALLKGGGNPSTHEALRNANIEPAAAASAIAAAFEAAMGPQ